MCVGIYGEILFLRLSDSDLKKITGKYSAVAFFEPMLGHR